MNKILGFTFTKTTRKNKGQLYKTKQKYMYLYAKQKIIFRLFQNIQFK